MNPLLFVIDPDRPDLFAMLHSEFEDAPNVAVVFDRRIGERRRGPNTTRVDDHRRGDRRRQATELQPLGWALIRPLEGVLTS